MNSIASPTAAPQAQTAPHPEVREEVRALLTQSEAFKRLPPAKQQQVARDTARIADYLVAPEGIKGNELSGGLGMPTAEALRRGIGTTTPQREASFQERQAAVDAIQPGEFEASAAREGAEVAGLLLRQVKFPAFVSSLIKGVFHSIVESSIEQMEAYSSMIAAVAQSLEQFMQDNVSENQGRDHMVDQFPDLFEIGVDEWAEEPGPRLRLRDGIDESDALRQVNNKISFENGELNSMDLSDENVEKALVHNARVQLAKQRQQLMASLVLMGINRIVVTDGRIAAKIMYDFRAQDRQTTRRSATAMDVARDRFGNVQTTREGEGEYDRGGNVSSEYTRGDDGGSEYNADYYAKGKYKYEDKPVITAMSTASQATDAAIQTRVQLAGNVEVNFKSDYLPLEKMATPGMIAAIQGNSTPVDPNVVPSPRAAPGAASGNGGPAAGGTIPPAPTSG